MIAITGLSLWESPDMLIDRHGLFSITSQKQNKQTCKLLESKVVNTIPFSKCFFTSVVSNKIYYLLQAVVILNLDLERAKPITIQKRTEYTS